MRGAFAYGLAGLAIAGVVRAQPAPSDGGVDASADAAIDDTDTAPPFGGAAGRDAPAPRDAAPSDAALLPSDAPDLPLATAPHRHGEDAAWLLVGSSLAFITIGAVLAYASVSSEQDIKDLYAGIGGLPPTFDDATQQRYNDLVDEGHRYQYLSWVSFGVAAGCAVGAAYLFVRGGHGDAMAIEPVATPHSAGISARWHF